jgi:hypothetical protein
LLASMNVRTPAKCAKSTARGAADLRVNMS